MLLCGWHLQKNFASKLTGLSKKDNSLFHKILNLPFVSSKKQFENIIEEVRASQNITEAEREYINEKLKTKEKWAKSETKSGFAGGVCTTSRIEGLHGVLKFHLNSNSNLQELFQCFQKIEMNLENKLKDEFNRHEKISRTSLDALPLQLIKEKFSTYIYKKIIPKFSKGLNYLVENNQSENSWY